MPMFGQPSVARSAGITAMATVLLVAGAAFALKGGTGSTTYLEDKKEFVTCTMTGGLAKYAFCNWHEPVDDSGSGSEVTGIYVSFGKSPKVIGIDGTIGPSATSSGSFAIPNLQNVQTASGLTVKNLTGSFLVNSGAYVRLVTLGVPNTAGTATMEIEYKTRLSK